jgi:Flp pilus assembly protein TadG
MIAQIQKVRTTFAADEKGDVAVMFGLMFAVILLAVGFGIDYSRITHTTSKTLAAADAAALAGGHALLDGRMTDAQVKALTLKFFNENMAQGGHYGQTSDVTVTVDRATGEVRVDANAKVDMSVMRTAGIDEVNVPVVSSVISDQKDIELAMALDVTGSMGGQKIADLRAAAKDLVDILLPDTPIPNRVRIGLAPYSNGVNAGIYANRVTNGTSTACVRERGGAQAFTDALPAAGTFLGALPVNSCPTAKIEPLTSDKTVLKNNINTYRAGGGTAGHLGAAWASYLVSPEWNPIWPVASQPVAYGEADTIKAIVLMTDGEFNTHYVNANGDSAAQARRVCTEAKREGRNVVIYSIGFQSPAAAEALLKDCATSPEHYFSANNGTELRQAFVEIAQQLTKLRLTQ